MITLFIFFILFLFEGAALLNREISLFLYGLLPAIYFLEKEIKKEKILISKPISFTYLFFIIFIFISFFTASVDKINSVDHLFFYFAAFFLLIIGFNEEKKIVTVLKQGLLTLSLVFSGLSLLPKNLFPPTAYQLVFPLYPNHNHLGDFLGLTLIWLLYDWLRKKNKQDLIFFLVLLLFFIFSFSRSAYIDFILIASFLFLKNKNRQQKKIILGLGVFIFFIFILTQKELYQLGFFQKILPAVERFFLKPRSIVSGRPEYFQQAIKGFFERPLFGWGIGNFEYLSKKYVGENLQQVVSALNLPLTVLAEVGLFGFFSFLVFWFLIFKNIDNKKAPINLLFYYLCLNFLTDYTYAIYGLFLSWFLLTGIILKKKNTTDLKTYPLFSLLILIFIFLKLTGKILTLVGWPEIAIKVFPYDHQTQQQVISQAVNDNGFDQAKALVNSYYSQSKNSFEALNFLGDLYYDRGEKKQALFYYQQLTNGNRFPPFETLKKVYWLKKDLQEKKIADLYFTQFFEKYKTTFWLNSQFEDEVYQFCFDENIFTCRFRKFYSPKPNSKEEIKNRPIKVVYRYNNDGLNERVNYSFKKQKGVFRILVLGDGNAFGFLVNTKDNWPEKLEDLLNQNNFLAEEGIKKFEVINLAYHSYDLAYAIERFRLKGIKYQPDLIIFMNNNFYRINEIFLPLTEKYYYLENIPQEKERLKKEGKYFPAWDLAWQEYTKTVKSEEIYQRQKQYLQEFFKLYQGPVVFISLYEIPEEIRDYLKQEPQVKIQEILNFDKNKDYYSQEIPNVISPKGYQALVEIIMPTLFK